MIAYKDGVTGDLHPAMRRVLRCAESIWSAYGQDLVVTAKRDGEHGKWSWHQYGCAVDLRTRYFSPGEVASIAQDMSEALGRDYDVVIEPTHMHVEYDWGRANAG